MGTTIQTIQDRIRLFLLWAIVLFSAVVLISTLIFLLLESRWATAKYPDSPQHAFVQSSIGTELIPLVVLEDLPDLFPDKFPPNGEWMKRYGFISPGWSAHLLKTQRTGNSNPVETTELPLGFSVSRHRPLSAYPSPVDFVGFSCVTCHSTVIRKNKGDEGLVIIGPGNESLNLLAFLENLKAAVMQQETNSLPSKPSYVLSANRIINLEIKKGKHPGLLERAAIEAWVAKARQVVSLDNANNDEPRVGKDLFNSQQNRPGPLRSNPFRVLIHSVLNRPGRSAERDDLDMSFVKFASVFEQESKEWAQFDGSIRKIYSRSALAAISAGATIENISHPEITSNIIAATDYVKTLAGPKWEDVFPEEKIDRVKAKRGQAIYREHCSSCHGFRNMDTGAWLVETNAGIPNRLGELVSAAEIGTDSERLTFSHADRLPQALHDLFDNLPNGVREGLPNGSPFAMVYDPKEPAHNEIRAAAGYLNSPLQAAFLRAPFLHNASVLTMRELINLDRRRSSFYRGSNLYDISKVGLFSQENADSDCEWRFDTSYRGNSNLGHDYPWPYSDNLSNDQKAQLEDLLEYTKML
jgi:hypothetical protein